MSEFNHPNRPSAQSPFKLLSELLIDNQNAIKNSAIALRTQIRTFSAKLDIIAEELEQDVFNTDLNILSNVSAEAASILMHAKDIEAARERILNSVEMLQKANTRKLS